MGLICKPPVLWSWNGKWVSFIEIFPRKESLGLGWHRCGSEVLSPHRGKVACLAHLPGMGHALNPFENSPQTWKGKASCGPGSGRAIGSELVLCSEGLVRVVYGERVGLRVEYPVFQGECVIFREQKVEIPVPPGQGGKRPPVSALGNGGSSWERISGASVTGLWLRVHGGPRPQIRLEGWCQGRCCGCRDEHWALGQTGLV